MTTHRSNVVIILTLAAALLAAAGCKKEPKGPDLTTPKGAALVFTTALENGDVDTARKASNASGMESALLEAMAESAAGIKQLHAAATAKFGEEANKILQQQSLNVTKNLASGEVEQGENRATVRSKDGRDKLQLLRVDGLWRVDVGALIRGQDVTNVVPFFRAAGVAAKQVAQDIDAGKITTVEQAREEMPRLITEHLPRLVREQYEASTRPAPPEIPGL